MSTWHAEPLYPDHAADLIRKLTGELPRVADHFGHSQAMLEGMLAHGASLFPGLLWASVSKDGAVAALVPLVPVEERFGPLSVRALYSPNRFDVLYADAQIRDDVPAADVVRALWEIPVIGDRPADILRLRDLRSASAWRAALLTAGIRPVRTAGGANFVSLIPGGESNSILMSKNLRNQIKRAERKLSESGEIDFHVYGREMDGALQRFLDLEHAGYKAQLNSLRNEHADLQILSTALAFCARSDRVVIAELHVGAVLAASLICLHVDQAIYVLKIAFNEALREGSPGTLLMARFLDFCEKATDVRRVDFCVKQSWHERWHPSSDDSLDFGIPNIGTPIGLALTVRKVVRR